MWRFLFLSHVFTPHFVDRTNLVLTKCFQIWFIILSPILFAEIRWKYFGRPIPLSGASPYHWVIFEENGEFFGFELVKKKHFFHKMSEYPRRKDKIMVHPARCVFQEDFVIKIYNLKVAHPGTTDKTLSTIWHVDCRIHFFSPKMYMNTMSITWTHFYRGADIAYPSPRTPAYVLQKSATPSRLNIRDRSSSITVDLPQDGRFSSIFSTLPSVLNDQTFSLWFPCKNTSRFYLQSCYCWITNGGIYCILILPVYLQ